MVLKRKRNGLKFILPFLLLAGMMLHSCTDEGIVDAPAWHQAVEQGDNAIMRAAKAMVEGTQGEMSMPDMVKTLGKSQTRAAGAAPQTLAAGSFTIDWEAAQSLHEEDGTVLLVPIKMKQNMAIWRFTVINNKRKAEQTPMHSVLYVKKFSRTGNIMGRVLSYAPSRQYIKRHPKYKKKIEWYNPDHTDYSGLLLISSLEGTLFHGFNYENGRRQFMFRPNTHAHEHSHGHESAPVTRTLALPDSCQYNHATAPQTETIHSTVFNMRMISSASAINTYSLNNETSGQIYCSFCGKLVDDCECLIVDGDVCDDCGKVIENCICPCPFCDLYPCGCGNGNCLFCNKPLHECECGDTVGGGDGNNNSSNNGNNNNQNQGGNGNGNQSSTPTPQLPSYSTLSTKFKEVAQLESSDVYKKIGGNVLYNHEKWPNMYNNACALRISYALNFSSANIPYEAGKTLSGDANNDRTSEWYYYKIVDLMDYLNRTYSQCESYDIEPSSNSVRVPDDIKGRKGIICFQKCNFPGNDHTNIATGHIDLWDGSNIVDNGVSGCGTIYFWEIK